MSEQAEQTIQLDEELEGIFNTLDGLTIAKAAKLVKALEERWGVSAAAPAAVMAAPAAGAPCARRARARRRARQLVQEHAPLVGAAVAAGGAQGVAGEHARVGVRLYRLA